MANPRVVIIGAGFGGLYAARTLVGKRVDVLLIDRQNFHTFTPLLYQVATSGLDPGEIAYPVRAIFQGRSNVRFMLGEVKGIDTAAHTVEVKTNGSSRIEPYDYLIVAGGSVTHYFGMEAMLGKHAFGLKTLSEAVVLRNHILKLFERAAWTDDPAYREALTTIVVVGGGPTGLETAGALYELYAQVLRKEYTELQPRVILIEAADRLLSAFPSNLQDSARKQLESLGVEVVLNNPLTEAAADHIQLTDGRIIRTHTLLWMAGVKASPLAAMLAVPLQRGGRVPVKPTMEMLDTETVGANEVYVVGDMAYLEDKDGQPYATLIPVAKQQGILAARNILRRLSIQEQKEFHYFDRGIMATIGRSRAVAYLFNRIPLTGFIAWVTWLGLHLLTLMGFRNRLNVLVNWAWNYLTFDRSIRIILEHQPHKVDESPVVEPASEVAN